jgi:uncharacterized protein
MEIIGYIASILVGFILGLLGGGGSILSIPILVYLFNIDPVRASAYSLFIVGVTSFVGAVPKYREHLVNLRTGIVFGIPSVAAIFTTRKWIIPMIPETITTIGDLVLTKRILILGIFAILMIAASFAMIKGSKEVQNEEGKFRLPLIFIEGSIIGLLTGLVGAGGGFLIIPALVFLTGLKFKTAVGTSLFIIAINSLMGFLGDALNYQMDWRFLLTITCLAIFGILIGNKVQRRFSSQKLRKAFGWMILAMGCYILIREIVFF